NSVFAGMPCTTTSMMSTGPAGLIFTVAFASGRHVLAPAETTMENVTESSSFGAAPSGEAVNNRLRAAGAARNCNFLSILYLLFEVFLESVCPRDNIEITAGKMRR